MNMLLLMTANEVVDYAELHATTDLERALLNAVEHFECDLDNEVGDAETERDEAIGERDDAKKRITDALAKLKELVGEDEDSQVLFAELFELLGDDE